MREIEVKFRLEDPEEMEGRLRELGCSPGPPVSQTSMLLDREDGGLRRTGRTLRIRISGDRLELTAKAPAEGSGQRAKVREEREVEVSGGTRELLELLAILGYRVTLVYRRERRVCELAGATVCLDSMDFGPYMEIEAESGEVLAEACSRLGLDPAAGDSRSYPELREIHRRRKADV